jgi:hypothetical protein
MKSFCSILILLITATCFGQKQKKVSVYADFHINKTLYDRTITNNAGGFGGGLQLFLNTTSKLRPGIEFTGDAFGGTKEMYLTNDGRPIYSKDVVTAILAGSSYQISGKFWFNGAAGAAFFNEAVYFTIKPAIGFYFPTNKRLLAKISLTHIFQRDDISDESFGYLNFCIGIKLF